MEDHSDLVGKLVAEGRMPAEDRVAIDGRSAFHRALTQFGAQHELVIYPREKHSFTVRAHQIDVLERARSWFTHWLGDPAGG